MGAEAYDQLKRLLREAETLVSVGALLAWDQETMMPAKAAAFRAEELAEISRLAHQRHTDPRIGELLEACEADAALTSDPLESANLREIRRDYERATKLPEALVAKISETSSRAMAVWKEARGDNDFERFRPWLEQQVSLNRRKAECYGVPEGGELYDALLEDFEPGMTAAQIERIFEPLRRELASLIAEAASRELRAGPDPDAVELPISLQRELNLLVAQRVGYDLEAGRLDVSTHPFTEGLAPGDTRITTRYHERGFTDALGSTLHEAGHALYEQGLPKQERHGQPLAKVVGLGIHESQSRMWENQVGRSRAFWSWALPEARRIFGAPLEPFSVDDLYRSVNTVRPSPIRVESDETTYNMHIMIRFDVERALLRGELDVADVPGVWNERMKQDLGVDVADDAHGCLQDIHWSMGAIGYFPTYTLGNLYSAQFWDAIVAEIPDLEAQIERGEFGELLFWLRKNIHAHGRRFLAPELCERLTGRPLEHGPLIRYLGRKQAEIACAGG